MDRALDRVLDVFYGVKWGVGSLIVMMKKFPVIWPRNKGLKKQLHLIARYIGNGNLTGPMNSVYGSLYGFGIVQSSCLSDLFRCPL